MEAPPVVVVERLQISFGSQAAVQDLSFSVSGGQTLAIVGESGSGKSLTALALTGLLPKGADWHGAIHINNAHIMHGTPMQAWQAIRGRVASIVFQEPMSALNPVMKVGRQLSEAIAATTGMSASRSKTAAIEWLRKVQLPRPEQSYHKYPHQLSGGQKQRVMIAIAMSANPALLIADEPTTALDVTVQAEIMRLLKKLQTEAGTALIFITHDLALAAAVADEVLVLRNGVVMEQGPAANVLWQPQNPYTRALLACRPGGAPKDMRLPVVADFLSQPESSELKNAGNGANRVVRQAAGSCPAAATDQPLLQVRHLRVWFPAETDWLGAPVHFLRAVEDVSFDLHRGEVLGLVGESGCGKSTVSRALMGLQAVESGAMLFEGRDLAHMNAAEWRRMRRDVQMIFQDPFSSLNPRMTVGDAIAEVLLVHGIVQRREVRKEAGRIADLVQLPADALRRYPHQFSGGQRQRIGIARAIALRPRLIICDESVSALDVSVQAQMLNLLKDLREALDLSYLFISHDLNVVHYMADRVLVMQAGKIVERGDADTVLKHPQQEYTRQLVAAMPKEFSSGGL